MLSVPTAVHAVEATYRLVEQRKRFPELSKAVVQARLTLAVAIMKMDYMLEVGPAIAEQAAVEEATHAYAAALADLVRGQKDSTVPEQTTCGKQVGSKPYWMGEGQYDPCHCILPLHHEGKCACEHGTD